MITEPWVVWYYNELDSRFGYDAGMQVYLHGLAPAVAKSIARHLNKTSTEFMHYVAEPAPRRYV